MTERFDLRRPRSYAEQNEAAQEQAREIDWASGQRGWRTIVPAPDGGWNGLQVDSDALSYNTRAHQLLDVDLRRYGALVGLGSYQLCLSAEVDPSVVNVATPLVARVYMGAGGIGHNFEVDANGQTFAVPADYCRVTVHWEGHRGTLVAPGVINVPATTVTATIVRSGQSYPSRCTRTKRAEWLEDETQTEIEVPEFARGFRVYGLGDAPLYTAGGEVSQVEGGRIIETFENLPRLSRDLCYRPVSARTTHLRFTRDADQEPIEWLVEFALSMGGPS